MDPLQKKRFFQKKFNIHGKHFWSKNQMLVLLNKTFYFLTKIFFHVRQKIFFEKPFFGGGPYLLIFDFTETDTYKKICQKIKY